MEALKPALQYSQGRSKAWSGAELINCFAEVADGDKREQYAVMPTPGLTQFSLVSAYGAMQGAVMKNGVLHVVAGGSLYSVNTAGVATFLANCGGVGSKVVMAASYDEVAIAGANRTGYVWRAGVMYTPLIYDVSSVAYADGFMVWAVANSEQFFISALDDALTYDATEIASVEGMPDKIKGMAWDHRELQFFGDDTIEIFYNSGAADFPFERQGNAFIERGCFDGHSIVKMDNRVFFIGNDRVAYVLQGYTPLRISTHAIEYQLRDASYCVGFAYEQEGHKFFGVECDRGSFLYDVATGIWHQRKSYLSDFWRCYGGITAYGKVLLFDRTQAIIYEASPDVYDEDGDPILMEMVLPTIEAGRTMKCMYSFEVTCETGVGDNATPDPQVMLQYSDDGGRLWSNEMWRSLGAVGEYRTRAVWRKLGFFYNRKMKLRIADSVKRLVIGYFAEIG